MCFLDYPLVSLIYYFIQLRKLLIERNIHKSQINFKEITGVNAICFDCLVYVSLKVLYDKVEHKLTRW